jgi:periplasmic protein TonB
MERTILSGETVAKRAVVGVAILGGHLALVLLLAASGFVVPTLVQSVSVSFIQPEERAPEKPALAEPTLKSTREIVVPTPEVIIPVEPASLPVATTEHETQPTPASPSLTTAPSTPGDGIPELSEVAYLVQPAPRYPAESRRSREQGLVVLRVLIDESGHPKTIEIYRSSGHPRLDEAARAAVVRAVFKPFVAGGIARTAAAIVPIEFSLHPSSS